MARYNSPIQQLAKDSLPVLLFNKGLYYPNTNGTVKLIYSDCTINFTEAYSIAQFQQDFWKSGNIHDKIYSKIPQNSKNISNLDMLCSQIKLLFFSTFYPSDFTTNTEKSNQVDKYLAEKSKQWPKRDYMLFGGNLFNIISTKSKKKSQLLLYTQNGRFTLKHIGSAQILAKQHSDFTNEVILNRDFYTPPSFSTPTFPPYGESQHKKHIIYCNKTNNIVTIKIPIPRHVYLHNGCHYAFPETSIKMTLKNHKSNVSLSEPKIAQNNCYKHPFVFNTNKICYGSGERWTEHNIWFDRETPVSIETANNCIIALREAKRTLISGWVNSPIPVNRFQHLGGFEIPHLDVRGSHLHKCT
jgi:hypothetical protein